MLYDYECRYCEYLLEDVQQKVQDDPLINCPACGEDALARIISGGAYAFVKNTNTAGGAGGTSKNKIQEEQHKKAEAAPEEKKPWYAKEGNATSQEIKAMTKKQQAKYIMEGKKK